VEGRAVTFIHVLEVVRRIRGSSIDEIYGGILAWLSKEKANIKKQDKPRYIRAEHGSFWVMWGGDRNAKKKIQISLSRKSDYTVFHMAMDAKWGYMYYGRSGYWGKLADELFADLGVKTESSSVEDLYDSFILERDRVCAFWRIMVGVFLLVSGFMMGAIWMVLFCGLGINEILAYMGVSFMFFGILALGVGFEATKIVRGVKEGKMPSEIVWAA